MFDDAVTETDNADSPNASKSIIKVQNGNISMAGDENVHPTRLHDTTESEMETAQKQKKMTFGNKRGNSSNQILGSDYSEQNSKKEKGNFADKAAWESL